MAQEEIPDNPGVLFPPPFIYLGWLAAGFGVDYFLPASLLPGAVRYSAGGVVIVLSLGLFFSAVRLFRKHGTSIRPDKPDTAILTEGPYRFTRNPIYLAISLLYLGISICADSPWSLAMIVPVLLIMNFLVIPREERYLARTFGEAYLAYKSTVRRWL